MENSYPAVIVISHGSFCEELVRSTAMVYGEVDRVECLPLEEGMDPELYRDQLAALLDKYDGNVFVCVDIMGGTPFKSLAYLARERKIAALAGINMPMLVEVFNNREEAAGAELAQMVCEICAEMPGNLTPILEKLRQRETT